MNAGALARHIVVAFNLSWTLFVLVGAYPPSYPLIGDCVRYLSGKALGVACEVSTHFTLAIGHPFECQHIPSPQLTACIQEQASLCPGNGVPSKVHVWYL